MRTGSRTDCVRCVAVNGQGSGLYVSLVERRVGSSQELGRRSPGESLGIGRLTNIELSAESRVSVTVAAATLDWGNTRGVLPAGRGTGLFI